MSQVFAAWWMRRPICRARQRGFALLIVLWSVVMLSAIATTMTASGRSDAQLARNLRSAAVAEAAADGAIYQAAFHLLDARRPWPADGTRIEAGLDGTRIGVCIANEAGKIDPNSASPGLMAALLRAVGADTVTAQRLAAGIYDWRTGGETPSPNGAKLAQYRAAGLAYGPSGAPFGSVGELRLVLGMTPSLLQRLTPYLTVWNDEEPDPRTASPVVMAAMRALIGFDPPAPLEAATAAPRTVTVTAAAETSDGARFVRHAVLRLATAPGQPPLRVLAWEEAEPASCR